MRSADTLVIAGRDLGSRLFVGTGKYKDLDTTREALRASGAKVEVTSTTSSCAGCPER